MAPDSPDPADYAEIFDNFIRIIAAQAGGEQSALGKRIADHLHTDPADLPIVSQDFDSYEHPNLQVALDAWLARPGTRHELVGISGEARRYIGVGISDLVGRRSFGPPLTQGPVDYNTVELADGRTLPCLEHALLLVEADDERFVVLVTGSQGMPVRGGLPLRLEILGRDRDRSQGLISELRRLSRELNVYRGQVISFAPGAPTPSGP